MSINNNKKFNILTKAFKSSFLEMAFRPIEPLLIFICAGIYVGGDWGEFKIYESFSFILYRICTFNFGSALTWYQPQVSEQQFVRSIFQTCTFSSLLSLLFILAIFLLNEQHPEILRFFNKDFNSEKLNTLFLFLLATPFMILTELLLSACITYKKFFYFGVIHIFLRPLFIFAPPIIAYFWFSRLNLSISFFLGNVIAFLLSLIVFFTTIPVRFSYLTWNIIPYKKILRFSFPLALSQWLGIFSTRIDLFMLASITNLQQVEIYSIALTLSKSLSSVSDSLSKFLHYLFASQKLSSITSELKKQFNYATWVAISIQSSFFIFIIIFGKNILKLIDKAYISGYSVILIVTLFLYINSHFNFIPTILITFGKTFVFPILLATSIITNYLLNLWLIPLYDSNGAAIALGINGLISSLSVFFVSYYYFRQHLFSLQLIKIFFISFLIISGIYGFTNYLNNLLSQIILITLTLIFFSFLKYRDYQVMKID